MGTVYSDDCLGADGLGYFYRCANQGESEKIAMTNNPVSMKLLRILVLALAMAHSCLSYADVPASEVAPPGSVAPIQRGWHALEFQATGVAGSVTTRIDLRKASGTDIRAMLLDEASLKSAHAAAGRVVELDVQSRVQLLVGGGIETRERLWFNEEDGLPLQLTRIRRGNKPSSKQYRFGRDRVYRLRKKPENETQAGQSPEHWSRSSESFYALPAGECRSVLESLQLFYLLSSPQYGISEASQTLCVFNRKHLYQVEIRLAQPGPIDLDHVQVAAEGKAGIRETRETIHLVINSRPLEDRAAAVKPFSFLGMQGEIHVLLSDPGRVPLRISGKVPGFGVIDLELRKLVGCADQDCIQQSNEESS